MPPAKIPTTFSVDLLIVTPDQLRKIDFKLSKDLDPSPTAQPGAIQWTLEFGLQERKKTTDDFADIIKLTVKIKPALHDKAEATAINGLDDSQTSAAIAAGDSAKLASTGQISKASANSDVKRIIARRGSSN